MCFFPGFCLITQVKADVPHGDHAGAAVPISPQPGGSGMGDGATFGPGATLSLGLSREEAANYVQHAEQCQIRFLSGKTSRWGPSSPLLFCPCFAFFLTCLMILQRSPNAGSPGQGRGQFCIPGDAPPKSGQPREAPASRDVLLALSIKVSPDKEINLGP